MKATKFWMVELDGAPHQIFWCYRQFFGGDRLYLDGQALEPLGATSHPLWKNITGYRAYFNNHLIAVFVREEKGRFHHELFIDGRSIETGQSMFEGVPQHYATLGVAVYSTRQQIQQAYQEWQYRFNDPRAKASPEVIARIADIRKNVVAAYAVLSDPGQRAEYDAQYPQVAHLRRRNTQFMWFVVIGGVLLVCLVLVFVLFVV